MPTPTIPMPADLRTPDGLLRPHVEVTFGHAAELARCSIDTVRRAQRNGRLPHAHQDDDSYARWWVPVADLADARLIDPASLHQPPTHAASAPPPPPAPFKDFERLEAQVMELTRALTASQEQAAALTRVLEQVLSRTGA